MITKNLNTLLSLSCALLLISLGACKQIQSLTSTAATDSSSSDLITYSAYLVTVDVPLDEPSTPTTQDPTVQDPTTGDASGSLSDPGVVPLDPPAVIEDPDGPTYCHVTVSPVKPDHAASSKPAKESHAVQPKVMICHIPRGNPANAHTIVVATAAVKAHLPHGDTLGSCDAEHPLDAVYEECPAIPGPREAPEGVLDGHFDLDTSHLVYPLSSGKTDGHVHEYDDKYMTASANFFELLDSKLHTLQTEITDASKRFSILITNAELSAEVNLEINGDSQNVLIYQTFLRAQDFSLAKVYTLGTPQVNGDTQLKSLKFNFPLDILQKGGLIPTATGCVKSNQPGANAEYRNGALTIQAIETGGALDASTHSAALNGGKLLWESTVFWHRDGVCYGSKNYVR